MDTPPPINHLSLCSGYEGIGLALSRVLPTCRTIAHVEIEAFAVANLVNKMEEGKLDPCPVWTNVKTFDGKPFCGLVDILSGGFPCQPFSAAGKREGDEDPRHLFPYIKNAIRTIQPRIVFLENVEGIISAKLKGDGWEDPAGTPVLLHVLRELERVGYHATAGVFSAAEVGATHQRKRVFILGKKMGDPGCAGLEGELSPRIPCPKRREESNGRSAPTSGVRPHNELADPNNSRGFTYRQQTELRPSGVEQPSSHRWPARPGQAQQEWEEPRVVADAHSNESASIRGDNGEVSEVSTEQGQEHCAVVSGGEGEERGVVGDADSGRQLQSERSEQALRGRDSNPSAELGDADCTGSQERAREPSSAVQGINPASGAKDKWQTESQLGGATDGSTSGVDATINRVDRLRLLGNGVVVETASKAFVTLMRELDG